MKNRLSLAACLLYSPVQVVLPAGMNGLYFCRVEDENGRIMGVSRLVVGDSK